MNYRLLSCWFDQRITTTVLGWVGALPVLMLSTDWVTQEYYFSNTDFFSSSSSPRCFVQWSKFLEEERGSELKKRRSSARWIWRLLCLVPARANICKRQACFDYTSPTQIECCHARMRYFSTLPVIKVRTDKWTHAHMHMDACSHMVLFFFFLSLPPPRLNARV